MQSRHDVVMATTELPGGVRAVWSPRDQVLVVDVHATPEDVADAWRDITGKTLAPTA